MRRPRLFLIEHVRHPNAAKRGKAQRLFTAKAPKRKEIAKLFIVCQEAVGDLEQQSRYRMFSSVLSDGEKSELSSSLGAFSAFDIQKLL